MNKKAETIALAALLVAAYCNSAWGQTPPSAILEIDIENVVEYITDITDLTQYGTKPNITPSNPTATSPRNLGTASGIGDIVAINGQPAKGALTFRVWAFQLSPAPSIPGAFPRAIADTQRASMRSLTLEILKSDGTQVGTIMTLGMGGGGAAGVPPGAPLGLTSMNFAIAGGNGAFLGARGQLGQASTSQTVGARTASIAEDPAYRRVNGGGRLRYVLHVIPMSTPQIVITGDGPAVYHTDFSPVTAAQPAKAGEVLIVKATGLGPTIPGINPGQAFPLDATQQVNSPVEVSVNGKPAEVINKIGWPGLVDTYRIDFRVPDGTASGTAGVQLTAAWIAGSSSNIAIK